MLERVAIASRDGIMVNAHFGGADKFHIVEIKNGSYSYIETRNVTPACHNYEHVSAGFDAVLNALSDCELIAVSRIGDGALEYAQSKGRKVTVYGGFIEDFLKEVIADAKG